MNFSHSAPVRRAAAKRGFTLVELMVVVIIIGILAAIAVPQITARIRDRRAASTATEIALLYRNARLRAMGRGYPVLVRYTTAGGFTVLDALPSLAPGAATAENCQPRLPPTCTSADWVTPSFSRVVQSFNPGLTGTAASNAGVTLTVTTLPTNTTAALLETCYSSRGKVYNRLIAANVLTPMTGIVDVNVSRGASTIARHVAILPNGMARLAL